MRYLKKFNESENFEEIYDEEKKFIENSMTYIADEYDLTYRNVDLDWTDTEDPDNCYHILNDVGRTRLDTEVSEYDLTVYVILEAEKFLDASLSPIQKISEYPGYLNEKYPNIITKLEKMKNDSIQFMQNNGNKVDTQFKIFKYYGESREYLKIRLTFLLKRN
jgi:predicted AlkP superfamily pyrophosphatase or phosphodiesterase